MFVIYGLHLEGDDEIRYIGSTCDPEGRLFQHMYNHDKSNQPKREWIAANYQRVKMRILQSGIPESARREAEQRAIKECQNKGHRLFNDRAAARLTATPEDVTWWLDRIEGDKPY